MHYSKPFYFAAELALFFVILPASIFLFPIGGWIYPLLWVLTLLCYFTLKRHHAYNLKLDWRSEAVNAANLRAMFLRFIPCAIALTLFTWVMLPERFFAFPLERPGRWLLVMLLYPLLSVFAQELVFRSYFFIRYASLFKSPNAMIAASAAAFGCMHVFLQNWVAVVFAAGGLLFAHTYHKQKSLALACIEHALYGCFAFTLGLGYYFYHGNIGK